MTGMDISGIEMRYRKALEEFFGLDEERALYEVSKLGKELVVSRMGPDVLLDVHASALRGIVKNSDPVTVSRMVVNANDILMSGIMAYAMSYYSYLDLLDMERRKLESVKAELQEKAEKLEDANAKLHEVDRLKSLFIASMSHELRNPLNSVIGFSSMLMDEWPGPLNEEQKEEVLFIMKAGKHLLALINDIIDISKVEAGKVEPDIATFDLKELLDEAVVSLSPEAAAKGLEVRCDSPKLLMETDRRRLMQCILNVAGNAVKYTEEGFVALAATTETAETGETAEITIADTGMGIPEEEQGRVFVPFIRCKGAVDSRIPGTGLGLYLTHKIVTEILGGTISLKSVPGAGTTVTLRIPRQLSPQA